MSEGKGPARGYSWPPFQPGHELSMRHGAWSPRKVDPLAEQLAEELLADEGVAYLRQPRWAAAVAAWARCEARITLVSEYLVGLAGVGQLGDLEDPRVTAAYRLLDRWEAAATQQRGRLGLDPLSASRIGRDVAQGRQADAATIMAELHRLELERKQREQEVGS